jgi:hypothetical protein
LASLRETYLSVDTFSLCELQLLLKFLVFNDLLLASGVRLFSITVALAGQKASSRPLHGLLCNLLIFKERLLKAFLLNDIWAGFLS